MYQLRQFTLVREEMIKDRQVKVSRIFFFRKLEKLTSLLHHLKFNIEVWSRQPARCSNP